MTCERSGRLWSGIALAVLLVTGGPVGAPGDEHADGAAEREDQARAGRAVRCMLPADVERLGSQLTRVGPRRIIETTAEECTERRGEVVEELR